MTQADEPLLSRRLAAGSVVSDDLGTVISRLRYQKVLPVERVIECLGEPFSLSEAVGMEVMPVRSASRDVRVDEVLLAESWSRPGGISLEYELGSGTTTERLVLRLSHAEDGGMVLGVTGDDPWLRPESFDRYSDSFKRMASIDGLIRGDMKLIGADHISGLVLGSQAGRPSAMNDSLWGLFVWMQALGNSDESMRRLLDELDELSTHHVGREAMVLSLGRTPFATLGARDQLSAFLHDYFVIEPASRSCDELLQSDIDTYFLPSTLGGLELHPDDRRLLGEVAD